MIMGQKRIQWIDGLRGIASLFIVLHHFIMGYYPAAYEGPVAVRHLPGTMEADFSQSPLAFIALGDFWVSMFCMVSGFVIAYQVYHMTDAKQFSKSLLKRYPRLMIPVFALSAIVYVMLHMGLFYNVQAANLTGSSWLAQFYQNKTTLSDLFFSGLIDTWIVGMATLYSNAFWMLAELFAGSFMAYILAVMGKYANKRILYVYLGVSLAYLSVNSRLTNFAIGVLLAYFMIHYGESIHKYKKTCIVFGFVLLVAAVIFGGYPQGYAPTNAYSILNQLPDRLNPCYFYHMIAAMLFMMGIYLFKPAELFLLAKPMQALGKISYSVYIVHVPILYSWSAWLLLKFVDLTQDYNKATGLMFIISMATILACGFLFYRFIEKPSAKWITCVVDKLIEDK